jgi:hypothetical protein
MKIKSFLILSLAVMASGLVSCSDEDYLSGVQEGKGQKLSLSGNIEQNYVTRVNDSGFTNGDNMGVYVVDYSGDTPGTLLSTENRADNVRHTFDETNNKWTSAYDIYFKDKNTPVDIYGYYPFAAPSNVNKYEFEVAKDQSVESTSSAMGGYEASDFLWGKATKVMPTDQVITLSLYHHMANVRVTLVEGDGFQAGEFVKLNKSLLVSNTIRKSVINMADGSVATTGDLPADGIIPANTDDGYRAIVVPQTVKAGTYLFTITIDNTVYTFKKATDYTYEQGKMHNFTIKINYKAESGKYELTLVDESITAWEADNVSHNGTAKEYVVVNVPKAGTLHPCITAPGRDYTKLKNMKVTGHIDARDFYFMRDSMTVLQALNLKEVLIDAYQANSWTSYKAYAIPNSAMSGKTSLLSLVLPDRITRIEGSAFSGCSNLTGSLIIPEGVTYLGWAAFDGCSSMTGSLKLPTTLTEIGGDCFQRCAFTCELILPDNLVSIGERAFCSCGNLYGSLKLPSRLTSLGSCVFQGCQHLTGSLEIPQGVKIIKDGTFDGCGFDGTLKLHNGITSIGYAAFYCKFRGELNLPKDLTTIEANAFSGNRFSGKLVLPPNLVIIKGSAFYGNARITGTLEIPASVKSIGVNAFGECSTLQGLVIPESCETIGTNAFNKCVGIGSIVCKGSTPAYVGSGAFNGVAKDNFTVEVPEASVNTYKTTSGWSDFKRIAAHHELVCRPSAVSCLNKQHTQTLVLNAEGDWTVQSKPDWCELSATSGSKKTELTLTVNTLAKGSATRTGSIVFKLNDKDYTTTCDVSQYNYADYDEDEVITLQEHTVGNGVNIVLLGDGFSAKEISEGTYIKDMKQEMEYFFAIEPYKTYRNYFNVYTELALSNESGVGSVNTIIYNKFNTTYAGGAALECDNDAVFNYALNISGITKSNLSKTLIIMIPNSTDYGGVTQMWADGSAIAFCPMSTDDYPYDARGLIQHEAGGHGFGKLADEYIYVNAFISACHCENPHVGAFNAGKACGWYDNLSLTGKMHEVPWSNLIFDSRYSDIVDIYEGGYFHSRGVYRSEQNSCMNNNIPYYSTISREAIVKRIMAYSGGTFDFETFVSKDSREVASAKTRALIHQYGLGKTSSSNQHAPIIHKGHPLKGMR